MKVLLLGLGISALVALTAGSAAAQNYPWCSQYGGRAGGAMNCGFSTFEQCMANVSGIGGFCIRNNTYVPGASGASAPHKTHKTRKHPNSQS